MLYLILAMNSLLTINSAFFFIGLLIFISLLLGRISSKLGVALIIFISLLGYLLHTHTIETINKTPKQTLLEKDTKVAAIPTPKPESYSPLTPPIIKPNKQKTPKYITKIQLEGISNNLFLQKFEETSGYTIAKKGDYLITFSYSGSIKKGNKNDGSRFVYSGGHLTVTVGSSMCCCNGIVSIPQNIPLGKSMKEGLKIMSDKVEEYALKNIDAITPMVVECLPKY